MLPGMTGRWFVFPSRCSVRVGRPMFCSYHQNNNDKNSKATRNMKSSLSALHPRPRWTKKKKICSWLMRHASTSIPVKSRVEVQVNSRFSPASTATGKGKLHHTIPRKWHDILLQSRNATGKYLLVWHQSCTNRCGVKMQQVSMKFLFLPPPLKKLK